MKKQRLSLLNILMIMLLLDSIFIIFAFSQDQKSEILPKDYHPIIHPADFTTRKRWSMKRKQKRELRE